jgi:rsbT co-antagonist protein RsbR
MADAMQKNAAYYSHIFGLTAEDMTLLQEAGQLIYAQQEPFFEQFYHWMRNESIFKLHYTDDVLLAFQENESTFWDDALAANIDDDFIERQNFFGLVFSQVGIPFDAYIAFIAYFFRGILEIYRAQGLETVALAKASHKVYALVMAVITDGYNSAAMQQMQEQNEALKAMSTPITKLWDGILLLPLVGFIDSARAVNVMTTALNAIRDNQSKAFILDISGIAAMDTAVANYLIKISKATRLMGCTCYLSGITGAVAETLVELGVQLDEVQTAGTMLDALKRALVLTKQSAY